MWTLLICDTTINGDYEKITQFFNDKKYPSYCWEDEIIYAVPKLEANYITEQLQNLNLSVDIDNRVITLVDADIDMVLDIINDKFCLVGRF